MPHSRHHTDQADFGMTYALPLVGDEIKLVFEVEAYKD